MYPIWSRIKISLSSRTNSVYILSFIFLLPLLLLSRSPVALLSPLCILPKLENPLVSLVRVSLFIFHAAPPLIGSLFFAGPFRLFFLAASMRKVNMPGYSNGSRCDTLLKALFASATPVSPLHPSLPGPIESLVFLFFHRDSPSPPPRQTTL